MTLYYSLVFGLLTSEIITFLVLVVPMPFAFKQKFFKFLSTNPLIAKVQYGLKISLIFTSILFFDAVQRMLKVVNEGQIAKGEHGFSDVRSESNFAARKFYSQRNVYLTGFTLFLSLILSRVFGIILDLINSQEELRSIKTSKTGSSNDDLKSQLDSKNREIEILKKQSNQNNQAMNDLVDQSNSESGSKKDK